MATQEVMKHIPLSQIRENPVALRAVNKQSEEYLGLVDSIRISGVFNPISVRELRDSDTGAKYYSLVDGLHRYNASLDAGIETIPAIIKNMEEGKILEAQLMANVHKVETRPVEYSKQISRILAQDPTLTANQLSVKLAKSPTWLNQRLGLVKLEPAIAKIVDAGDINLSNAFALAKLPAEEQVNFVDRAMTMSSPEFAQTANARIKELRDAKREGRVAGPSEFVPVAHLRKVSEIRQEAEKPEIVSLLIREHKLTNPDHIAAFVLSWALHLDPHSVEVAKAKDASKKTEAAIQSAARKAERDAKRAETAAATQQALQAGTVTV